MGELTEEKVASISLQPLDTQGVLATCGPPCWGGVPDGQSWPRGCPGITSSPQEDLLAAFLTPSSQRAAPSIRFCVLSPKLELLREEGAEDLRTTGV